MAVATICHGITYTKQAYKKLLHTTRGTGVVPVPHRKIAAWVTWGMNKARAMHS